MELDQTLMTILRWGQNIIEVVVLLVLIITAIVPDTNGDKYMPLMENTATTSSHQRR